MAGYCSLALDAIPVGNTNNKTVSETGSGGSINNATVDEAGNDITNATLHEIGSGDNIHNAVATVDENEGDSNNTKVDDVGSGGNINNATVDEIVEANENQVLFEGDIEISIEDIRKFYDLTKEQEKELMSMVIGKNNNRVSHVGRRAAMSDKDMLWTHRTVPYVIHDSVERRRNMIMEAINAWSDSTCLSFVVRTSQCNYIRFIEHNKKYSSSEVGRIKKLFCCGQEIKLTNDDQLSSGIIMHEIGHVLGLWHEQSRPDRDSYVTVYSDNIQSGKRHNFVKRNEKEVDYQGTEYDYGSIMHYRRKAFLKDNCTGSCLTLNVSNSTAFKMQGIPLHSIGQRNRLSPTDIEQVNRLYSCPGPGEQGFLTIYIRNGVNLEDTDNVFTGNPDAYVTVKAISSTGIESNRKTSYKQGTRYPTWNEWLLFSDKQWQFFRIRVWDNDISSGDDPMGMSETILLLNQSRNSTQQKHCTNTACDRYILFDYNIMLLTPVRGYLWVKINYARNLPDTDNTLNGDPDPYTSVRVITPDGSSSSKQTTYIQGTRNPTWNQWLEMSGCDESAVFAVQVWDDDTFSDEKVLAEGLFEVASGHHTNLKHCLSNNCNSYLYLDYKTLIPREHAIRAYLHIKVRYAHNLPDTDNTLNGDPDPYVRVTAFWCSGSDSRETSYIQGTRYPSWNEWLGMGGCHNFVGFKAQVWDDDIFSDEEMFTPEPFEVALGSHSNITHCVSSNCLSYLYLDYKLLIPVYGYLRVKIRYAYNLPDADGFLGGDPDPYVHVTAFSCSGSISKQTHYIQGTKNPTWNRWLEMSGCRDFTGFKVQVWDDDDT